MTPRLGHDEHGQLVPVQEFDWEQVERDLFGKEEGGLVGGLSQKETDAALRLFSALMRWVWQNGARNPDGIQIRAILVCWIFIKELSAISLTDLARGFGKHKQSLGRWHDDFKRRFPQVKTPHMRPAKK